MNPSDNSRHQLVNVLAEATHENVLADTALKEFRLARRFVNPEGEAERKKLESTLEESEQKLEKAQRALQEYDQKNRSN